MKRINITDMTLRECSLHSGTPLSFKEKIEIAKRLDKLNISVIEMPHIEDKKVDTLLIRTIATLMNNSTISCPIYLSKKEADVAWEALSGVKKSRINVISPVSPVQMEYICHKKPDEVIKNIAETVKYCVELCGNVEFTAEDATRSEKDFLSKAIKTAIENGAKTITLCDSAGLMLPEEVADFIKDIKSMIPEIEKVDFAVDCNNEMFMATACAIQTMKAGATIVKTTIMGGKSPALGELSHVIRVKGHEFGFESALLVTELQHAIKQISLLINSNRTEMSLKKLSAYEDDLKIKLGKETNIETLTDAVKMLGYDLNEDDMAKVFDAFLTIASKKQVGAKELEAIIASTALQIPPTYKLVNYVINSGNVFNASAQITLEKENTPLQGISVGDGPIDAAFRAIEQIVGFHYELEDFQIQSVTEGKEAMGDALVKLRHGGKLFSGKGISTDIIGASIRAYINALNKIVGTAE